jgi:cytoskeleton protein RodZ
VFEIGSSLRDARVRQGLDLLQLEEETKIRSKYLRALEEERFDLLPGDAYVKGFLRTYAERLGLDGQLYVDEYNSRFALAEEPVFASHPGRRSRRQRRLESHAVLIALAGIVAVTVLVIAAWQLGGSGSGPPATGTPASPASSLEETASEPAAITAAEPAAPSLELVVDAVRGSSVVEVRRSSATGELLFEGTIERGRSEAFTAQKKLWLRLSKPENLEFELNGTAIGTVAATGPSLVVVTADGIRRIEAP